MRFEDAVARLERLPDRLPAPPEALRPLLLTGADAVPVDRDTVPVDRDSGAREAAVLVLVYPGPDGEPWTILTARPTGDLRHAGEVSFPGGAVEAVDASMADTAVREAREEVGLDPAQCGLRVVGELAPVEVRVSGFRLHPIIAVADRCPDLTADAREVSAILEVPLRSFVTGAPIETVEEDRAGRRIRYGAYLVAGQRIWGATARVLGQLGALLAEEDA